MSNCVITLEITEYQPETLSFEPFGFVFRTEPKDFEDEITFINKNPIIHMTPMKKEIKYNIKVTKKGSLIGIAEYIIPNAVLQSKEDSFTTQCTVTMTDSMKRIAFGNLASGNTMKIQVKSTIQYVDKLPTALKQSQSLPKKDMKKMPLSPKLISKSKQQPDFIDKEIVRETKTPPLNAFKKTHYVNNNNKPVSNNKKGSQLKSSPQSKQQKTIQTINQSDSKTPIHNTQQPFQLVDNECKDFSSIDPLACEFVSQIVKQFSECIAKYNEEFNIDYMQSINDAKQLIAKSKESIGNLFELQINYYKQMNQSIELNKLFKHLLIRSNEKYRSVIKKQNRLKELTHRNSLKKEMIDTLKPEDDDRSKEVIPIKKQELNIYHNVFNMPYLNNEVNDIKGDDSINQTKDSNLLIQVMRNAINNYGNISTLIPNGQAIVYQELVEKYLLPKANVNINGNQIEQKQIIPIPENKINEEIEEEDHDTKRDNDLENVIGSNLDLDDVKLNKYLNAYYAKRGVIRIPFKKISPGNYEYGTKQLKIKIEGDLSNIKCNGGGYNQLENFIDANVVIEDTKIKNKLNFKNPSNKAKGKQAFIHHNKK